MGLVVLACAAAAAGWWWLDQPLRLAPAAPGQPVEVTIAPGTSARSAAAAIAKAGVQAPDWALFGWFRLSGQSRQIKAGSYEFAEGTTPRTLLGKLVRGEQALRMVTLVEGWTFRQVRQALARAERLQPDSRALDDAALMAALGRPGVAPEGRFFPDTYAYPKGASDLAVLRQALQAMDRQLDAAWSQRADDQVLKTPEQALILASIVEKETGRAEDREQISAVFHNRLRIGMPLQTDPTVIYGLGERFDGNLRRRDLRADTPFNTYTRTGLPPTPIAMPGASSLLAAVRPSNSKALYFVARGDGSSHFSHTLDEHNRAVDRYQR
ncbi:endolytic transglycosylase MltG [Pseudorhodoferax sp.]|uniref:endolytic transglycosylase MltG n=1 Tax=Pseudorhodoferax sp. TaxID=1993553 RepID=UPI0039E6657D